MNLDLTLSLYVEDKWSISSKVLFWSQGVLLMNVRTFVIYYRHKSNWNSSAYLYLVKNLIFSGAVQKKNMS